MKSNLDKLFLANTDLEKDGVDFIIQEKNEKEGLEEISFRLRRYNDQNPRHKAAQAAHYKPHARQIELGTLSASKMRELLAKTFIDVCLVSWTGVQDEKGEPITYTKESALALFTRLPDLFDTLWNHASDFKSFKEDVGN